MISDGSVTSLWASSSFVFDQVVNIYVAAEFLQQCILAQLISGGKHISSG